jgi:hypothetical protein
MTFAQSTIEEIVESERLMLVNAKKRYGKYYAHTREVSVFLSQCIVSVGHDRMMFGLSIGPQSGPPIGLQEGPF